MKKHNLKIRKVKLRREKLLLKQIVNQYFDGQPRIFWQPQAFLEWKHKVDGFNLVAFEPKLH